MSRFAAYGLLGCFFLITEPVFCVTPSNIDWSFWSAASEKARNQEKIQRVQRKPVTPEEGMSNDDLHLLAIAELFEGSAEREKDALKALANLAARGHVDSQELLGALYSLGSHGVTKDEEKVVYWYKKAAENGGIGGLRGVAARYLEGSDVLEQDVPKGIELFERAAQLGDIFSMVQLGKIYASDEYGVKRIKRARYWYERAVEKEDADAQFELAKLHQNELENPKEAKRLFLLAANGGHNVAQLHIGRMYFNGLLGEEIDFENARKWLEKAKEAAFSDEPDFLLGRIYEEGLGVVRDAKKALEYYLAAQFHAGAKRRASKLIRMGDGAPSDLEVAYELLKDSALWGDKEALQELSGQAQEGDHWAQFFLGVYFQNKVSPDLEAAFGWYLKSASQGNVRAMILAGVSYNLGKGVGQDHKQGYAWISRAANKGEVSAMGVLGDMLWAGNGVKQDLSTGCGWYRKAVNGGFGGSEVMLGVCYYTGDIGQKDYAKAWSYFDKNIENPVASHFLGFMGTFGLGVRVDLGLAQAAFRQSSKERPGLSGFELADYDDSSKLAELGRYASVVHIENMPSYQKNGELKLLVDARSAGSSLARRALAAFKVNVASVNPPPESVQEEE